MTGTVCRIKEFIQPFERKLALGELAALAGTVRPIDGCQRTATTFMVDELADPGMLRGSLAYWRSVGDPAEVTTQLRSEATSVRTGREWQVRNGSSSPVPGQERYPRRRCLRYATHGLHEYRGKFFPQLVRALINISRVPESGIVLDPMCGSGTTLVESMLAGRTTYGLDMNPLSAFMADVKCRSLSLTASSLRDALASIEDPLASPSRASDTSYIATLQEADRGYLANWFSQDVLDELDAVQDVIGRLRTQPLRDFYTLALSNILRGVSWQKDSDLRVRRDMDGVGKGEVVTRFLKEARRSVRVVAAFLEGRGQEGIGRHHVAQGDARVAASAMSNLAGRVDAIITSPPYATALPYIDTDRLSLAYLGLSSRTEHRDLDRRMIGNREVTVRDHAKYWSDYEASGCLLPSGTREVIDQIEGLNRSHPVGFRRRNLGALLAKYFLDMRIVLGEMKKLLKPDGVVFVVVGNNRTTAGTQRVDIRTADHLTWIAESLGFRATDTLSMDMLASRDIFRKNAVPSEKVVTLRIG